MSHSATMRRPTPTVPERIPAATADWQETWAYVLGMQAYTYGYPWV